MNYWRQVADAKRKPSTHKPILAVDDFLCLPTEKETVPPLYIHSGYSRFVFTLIQKGDVATTINSANIPAGDVGYVYERTKIAMQMLAMNAFSKPVSPAQDPECNSIAYTQTLADKKYSGKTPAAVLTANPGEKANLLKTKDWLSANLQKYPGNQKQIDAIDEAVQLLDMGELIPSENTDENLSNGGTFVIYDEGCKYTAKKNEKGYRQCYDVSIYCNAGRDFPYTFVIKNYFAPVIKSADGSAYVKKEQAEGATLCKMVLSEKEWFGIIERCYKRLTEFEMLNSPKQREKMLQNSYKFE